MKSKIPSTIFRIFTILTTICGMIMTVNFVKALLYVSEDKDVEDARFAEILANMALFFFPFLIMTGICIIMSIICFKAYNPVISVIRTLFMVGSFLFELVGIKIMKTFILLNDFFNGAVNDDLEEYIDHFSATDAEVTMMVMPMLASFVFVVFFASSLFALVKGPKLKENVA